MRCAWGGRIAYSLGAGKAELGISTTQQPLHVAVGFIPHPHLWIEEVTRNTATQGNVGIHRISFANLADEVQCAASILKLASRLDKGLNDTFLDSTAPHKLRKPFV